MLAFIVVYLKRGSHVSSSPWAPQTPQLNDGQRIPNTNYSIRGAYTHGNGNGERCAADYNTDTYQIAFVIDLGSGSARERDQHGASLQGADAFDTDWRLYEPACD
jgi:hypothetical protein